jgi:hypothetical protein
MTGLGPQSAFPRWLEFTTSSHPRARSSCYRFTGEAEMMLPGLHKLPRNQPQIRATRGAAYLDLGH